MITEENKTVLNKDSNINSVSIELGNTLFPRPNKSLGLSMGIVGLPNVGKSTLVNGLTKSIVRAENFAFCTVDPNIGHVKIEDPRLDFLAEIYNPKKTVNSTLSVFDIAGLVKGSHEGVGLGNKFLSHIQRVDAIFMVVRCFQDSPFLT